MFQHFGWEEQLLIGLGEIYILLFVPFDLTVYRIFKRRFLYMDGVKALVAKIFLLRAFKKVQHYGKALQWKLTVYQKVISYVY